MTVEQIKAGIEQSSPEERAYLVAFSRHLSRKDDPAYHAGLSNLNQEIDDGHKVSFAQLRRLHGSLEAEDL